ncbi:MAG: N-methyl-L-tryptophan oxidase [Actinomycetota bacterium]
MSRDYRHIVVGLGGIGSAAAYWLARRCGADVLGLERFEIGHERGASHDHSRIIRHSYHTPAYVELTRGAYDSWAQLEADADETLIVKTGGIDLWPAYAAIPMEDYTSSLTACSVPYELLGAHEVMQRWPQFRIDDDTRALFQADGGIAPAARCNAAHIRMARRHGATLRERAPVTSVRPIDDEFEVAAGGERYRCERLVIAADAWTNEILAHFDVELPLTVTQEQVTYWASPRLADFAPDRFPIWIWMDEPSFYGFPVFGERGVKAAQDVGGREVTPQTRTFDTDREALRRVTEFLDAHIPDALGPIIYTKSCLYTMPPDRDFVIDAVPGQPHAYAALGAAHGFKFASLFGRILSDLALDGETRYGIDQFAVDRPSLTMKDPVKSFMI